MTEKTDEHHQFDGKNHDDQGLSEELESLYHRVARRDQADLSGELIADPQQGSEFKDPRSSIDLYRCLPNQEEMMEKLMAIKEAYEKILNYWPYTSEYPLKVPTTEDS